MIIVYTKTPCPACDTLKKFLDAEELDYEVRNITENPEYKDDLINMGIMSVPVTVIGNREPITGFSPAQIMAALD